MGKGKKIGIGVGITVGAFFVISIIAAAMMTENDIPQNESIQQASQTESAAQVQQHQTDTATTANIENNSQVEVQSFSPLEESVTIVNGPVSVDAGGYVVYTFSAPKDSTNARLNGEFTFTDGSLKVLVSDGYIFDQWKEGRRMFFHGNLYYSSTSDNTPVDPENPDTRTLDFSLYKMYGSIYGETLYLVFDNTDDSEMTKHVNATFELTYTRYLSK